MVLWVSGLYGSILILQIDDSPKPLSIAGYSFDLVSCQQAKPLDRISHRKCREQSDGRVRLDVPGPPLAELPLIFPIRAHFLNPQLCSGTTLSNLMSTLNIMKSFFLVLSLAAGSLGGVLERAACNADNCARAVTGTRYASAVQASHIADCSSFMVRTITPATSYVPSMSPQSIRRTF